MLSKCISQPVGKFHKFHRKRPALWSLFLINPEGLQIYLKETPTQAFSCKIYDIFKNAYFEEHLRTGGFTLNLIFKTLTAYCLIPIRWTLFFSILVNSCYKFTF